MQQPQRQPQQSAEAREEMERRERELRQRQAALRAQQEAERLRREQESQRQQQEKEQQRKRQQQEREQQERQQRLEKYRKELKSHLEQILAKMGFIPPDPSPFLRRRALTQLLREVEAQMPDRDFADAVKALEREVEDEYKLAHGYFERLRQSLSAPTSVLQKARLLFSGVSRSIDQAAISIEMPDVAPALQEKMRQNERFLATNWSNEKRRGMLAVHVDEAKRVTILQIGIAEFGPIYVTIPRVLQPEDVALKSIRALIGRLTPFQNGVDPMAVINGAHQGLNYNEIFRNTRVMRAPSGNTQRLTANVAEAAQRERLAPENTVIVNSAPSSREQYLRVFPHDTTGRDWPAWGEEAELWNGAVTATRFAAAPEPSAEMLLAALSHAKNVIVIVAHCDGHSLFMPEPPPRGTEVTADYLLENRAQIAANRPFVYLFSCEAGDLANLQNFASTLLECGASGVVASQSVVGSAEGRPLLERLLSDTRGRPPLEDYYRAMRDVNFRDMEVFLA
jgi:hypothetical protein